MTNPALGKALFYEKRKNLEKLFFKVLQHGKRDGIISLLE